MAAIQLKPPRQYSPAIRTVYADPAIAARSFMQNLHNFGGRAGGPGGLRPPTTGGQSIATAGGWLNPPKQK